MPPQVAEAPGKSIGFRYAPNRTGSLIRLAFCFSERRIFSRQEIAALNSELKNDDRGDAMKFTIIDNKIYDVTDFVHEHPGGAQVLLTQLGKDATGTYFSIFFFHWA